MYKVFICYLLTSHQVEKHFSFVRKFIFPCIRSISNNFCFLFTQSRSIPCIYMHKKICVYFPYGTEIFHKRGCIHIPKTGFKHLHFPCTNVILRFFLICILFSLALKSRIDFGGNWNNIEEKHF